MGKVIGIDLGTTNSCVAVMELGEPTVITNLEGNRTTPSVVGFSKDGERLVGQIAKRQAVVNHDRTIASIKRDMGTDRKVKIGDKEYSPQEISAMILQKLKSDAESYLGEEVTDAVITVPAYFTDSQRQATKDAGKIAGLNVLRIINEPTAAALAYGIDKEETKKKTQKVLIYDLGGGTFDVSILEINDGVFEVLATAGNNKLGGDDFDDAIIDYVVKEFRSDEGIDLSKDSSAMQRIKDSAEKAKIDLSSAMTTNINIPFITSTPETGPKHIDINLTRAKFDDLTFDLVDKALKPLKQALKDAGMKPKDIDKVVLVGGSTRIPAVINSVEKFTGKKAYKGINPDECVALGAAVQAGVLAGEVKDILLLDVTPLSLGIETLGGVFTRLIERNTTIPTSKSQIFSTAMDNQPSVEIHVLQGERSMAADNKSLGRFQLDGIPPAPRGIPQIEVMFDIDANGIVNVKAIDKATNKSQSVTITASTNLTEEDIDKAIKEAEQFKKEDEEKKEFTEKKNDAEQLIIQSEKFINENKEKLEKNELKSFEKAIEKAKEELNNEDLTLSDLKKSIEKLSKVSTPIVGRIYQEAQTAAEEVSGVDKEDAEDNIEDIEPEIIDVDPDIK